jgi:hypothetical protein
MDKIKPVTTAPATGKGKIFSTPKTQAGITNAKSHKNGRVTTSGMSGSK